eukprot:4683026-Amphidinium_carterae.1
MEGAQSTEAAVRKDLRLPAGSHGRRKPCGSRARTTSPRLDQEWLEKEMQRTLIQGDEWRVCQEVEGSSGTVARSLQQ